MSRILRGLLIAGSLLLVLDISSATGQVPDGTVKITSRMVAPPSNLNEMSPAGGAQSTWGEGVLTYKSREYPFTFKAAGLFRDIDTKIAASELSGRVFELKRVEDFSGNYQKVESEKAGGAGTGAAIKNQKGVIVNLVSTVEGRKFTLAREGMDIELKK